MERTKNAQKDGPQKNSTTPDVQSKNKGKIIFLTYIAVLFIIALILTASDGHIRNSGALVGKIISNFFAMTIYGGILVGIILLIARARSRSTKKGNIGRRKKIEDTTATSPDVEEGRSEDEEWEDI